MRHEDVFQLAQKICAFFKNKQVAILMVEEAGGKVTDWDGNPLSLKNCSNLVFYNGHLHNQILALNRD